MTENKHPLDEVAEQLEAEEQAPVAAQEASPDFWELRHAADETVGDYPQAVEANPVEPEWNPETGYEIDETEGLDPEGYPRQPIAQQKLQETAKWTDVLSANLWSEGYLMNDKAAAVFKACELGDCKAFAVGTLDHDGSERGLTYLYFKNEVPATAFDFERSTFYVTDMLGGPLGDIDINSFEQWKAQLDLATEGKLVGGKKFSGIRAKELFFKRGEMPGADLFTIERIGAATTYITKRLRDALVAAGITGLDIRENKRLYLAN